MHKLLSAVLVVSVFPLAIAVAQTSNERDSLTLVSRTVDSSGAAARSLHRPVTLEESVEARRLYKEAMKYRGTGLVKQACQILQRVVMLDPDYAAAYLDLGLAYLDLGQWEKAIKPLQEVLRLDPNNEQARNSLQHAQEMLSGPRKKENKREGTTQPSGPEGGPVSAKATTATEGAAATRDARNSSGNPPVNDISLTRIYRVGPGDVLDVRLGDLASSRSTLFTVTPAGLLEHPSLTEPLPVAGLTVEEISARLEDDLRRRALADNPKVPVGVRDYLSHSILVSGLVKEPGTKILRREAIPLYVVIADAQPLPEAARVVMVRSGSGEAKTIDLAQPAEMNLLVRPGDVISIQASLTQYFYLGGTVNLPGEKVFRRGLTLTQAVIAGGGLGERSKEARVARDNGNGFLVVTRYKLKDIDTGKKPDPLIQPRDRITIVD
jgi:protein involved in polysaccharide export with SLBB domain/Tfp pilus assembly protein PilF